MSCNQCFTLGFQKSYHGVAISKTPQRKFTDNERMTKQPIILDDLAQFHVSLAEMINPH